MNIVKVKDVATFVRGVSYKKEQATKEKKSGYLPLLRANNISAGSLIFDDLVYVPKNLVIESQYVKPGDIIVSMSSGSKAHVGKVALAKQSIDYTFGAFCGKVSPLRVFPPYLYYLLCDSSFRQHIETICKGTNINNLKQSYIMDYEIPVPSFSEQIKIVSRIEELFSELDAGVETLQKIKQQLAVYRQAVLSGAFSGELTGSAVRDYGILSEFIEKPRYGTSKKCSYEAEKGGIPVYRIPNIDHLSGCISSEDIKYATFNSSELNDLRLESGDLLIIRSNGSVSLVGRAAIVREEQLNGVFAGYLMRLRIKDHAKLLPRFLLHYLNSQQARTYIENKAKSTSGVHNINSKEISDLVLPIYSIEDQVKIIEAIESRISLCDAIGKTVEQALQGSAAMRQSILKQAFEGGLSYEK